MLFNTQSNSLVGSIVGSKKLHTVVLELLEHLVALQVKLGSCVYKTYSPDQLNYFLSSRTLFLSRKRNEKRLI